MVDVIRGVTAVDRPEHQLDRPGSDTAVGVAAELDVQVVVGSATVPSTLRAAGVERAGLLAGVTQNDEVNLLASLLAKQAGVPQTVVRISKAGATRKSRWFGG